MEAYLRSLSPKEKKAYQDWLAEAERSARRSSAFFRWVPWLCCSLIGPGIGLWVGLESSGPRSRQWQLGAFGFVVAEIFLGIFFWEIFKERRAVTGRVAQIKKAIADDRVECLRVRASEVVAFEEIGDLGPYFAFQVGENEIFCAGGQNYADLDNFPNDDFEIAKRPLIDDEIYCHGKKLKPTRTIPSSVHCHWRGPNDGDGYAGKLADLERILGVG